MRGRACPAGNFSPAGNTVSGPKRSPGYPIAQSVKVKLQLPKVPWSRVSALVNEQKSNAMTVQLSTRFVRFRRFRLPVTMTFP